MSAIHRYRFPLLLLLAVVLLVSPGAATATGAEAIRILSQSQEVEFPRGIRFFLEAESDTEIVEVRLVSRAVGGYSTYAYADFQPGTRVQATYLLRTSGDSYIPPGIELEYSYVITNSQGQTLETPFRRFQYIDPRFRWQKRQVGPLELYWHDLPQPLVDSVAAQVEQGIKYVQELLQVSPQDTLRGLVYNSSREAQDAFPLLSSTLKREQVFAGYAFQEWDQFLAVGMEPWIIVHETTHLLLGQYGPGLSRGFPSWVEEGLATYAEEPGRDFRARLRGVGGEDLLPLRNMNTLPGRPKQIDLFYRQAPVVVEYLLESYGPERFRAFLTSYKKGQSVDQALRSAYGFGLEELDQRWREGIAASPAQGAPGDADFWLRVLPSALVVLALAAAAVGLFLRRRQQRRESQEGE